MNFSLRIATREEGETMRLNEAHGAPDSKFGALLLGLQQRRWPEVPGLGDGLTAVTPAHETVSGPGCPLTLSTGNAVVDSSQVPAFLPVRLAIRSQLDRYRSLSADSACRCSMVRSRLNSTRLVESLQKGLFGNENHTWDFVIERA